MSYKRVSPVPIIEGGTGAITMTTAYAPVCAGTTATDALQVASTGLSTSGFVLTSTGVSSLPSFQAASITITGDVGSATGSNITLTGGSSGAIFTGSGSTVTESFNYLSLPTTTSTDGQILINGQAAIHYYGMSNVFLGGANGRAGNFTLTAIQAQNNSGIGVFVLQGLTTGTANSVLGYNALSVENTGSRNAVVGANSFSGGTGNSNNAALGYNCGASLSGASYDILIGRDAGSNYSGSESSNILMNSSGNNGESNTLRIGSGTGTSNKQLSAAYISGIDGVNVGNVAKILTMASDQIGTATITAGTGVTITPTANTITIAASGTGVTTIAGDSGTATGSTITLTGGSSGAVFTASGSTVTESFNYLSLPTTTSGGNGVIKVNNTQFMHSYGTNNTFLGETVANFTLTGQYNTFLGHEVGQVLTSGSNNSACGRASLLSLQGGSYNCTLGQGAFYVITSGSYNIGIGENAGGACTNGAESSNIYLNNPGANAESNTLRIGSATGSGSQQLAKAYISGIDGVNVGSVAKVLTMASDQLGTATITAGTGITVTPTANTITIASTAVGIAWSVITANQTAVVNSGYICNKAGTLALLLPATAAIGDIIEVTGINTALGWQITQSANQQIFFGTSSTTLGATGTLTSSAIRDSIKMVCVVAGASTVWNCVSSVGNITIV